MAFTEDDLVRLEEAFATVERDYRTLIRRVSRFPFTTDAGWEYAFHGFIRRLRILQRCIENVYEICPPNRREQFSEPERLDLMVNLQSFVFNTFGCVDNLAWIWAGELEIQYRRNNQVTFASSTIRETLPKVLMDYIDSIDNWMENQGSFRHALAHRIPLYVPPYVVDPVHIDRHNELEDQIAAARRNFEFDRVDALTEEQSALGVFSPVMVHSFRENSPRVPFHPQIIADWRTIVEMSNLLFDSLEQRFDPN